jgi:hypothetical protein
MRSPVMQALALLILRGHDIVRFRDAVRDADVDQPALAFSLWGAAFGLANLPKTVTAPYLESPEFALESDYVAPMLEALGGYSKPYRIPGQTTGTGISAVADPEIGGSSHEKIAPSTGSHSVAMPKPSGSRRKRSVPMPDSEKEANIKPIAGIPDSLTQEVELTVKPVKNKAVKNGASHKTKKEEKDPGTLFAETEKD